MEISRSETSGQREFHCSASYLGEGPSGSSQFAFNARGGDFQLVTARNGVFHVQNCAHLLGDEFAVAMGYARWFIDDQAQQLVGVHAQAGIVEGGHHGVAGSSAVAGGHECGGVTLGHLLRKAGATQGARLQSRGHLRANFVGHVAHAIGIGLKAFAQPHQSLVRREARRKFSQSVSRLKVHCWMKMTDGHWLVQGACLIHEISVSQEASSI